MLTHWKKAFKSDHLSSCDIDEKEVLLTVAKVELKECTTSAGKKMCNVATFKENGYKPMILNVKNTKMLRDISGNKKYLEEIINIPVTVYVNHRVQLGPEIVEGLRLKPQAKKAKETLDEKHPKFQDAKKALQTKSATIEQIKTKYDISPETEKLLIDGN